MSPFYGCRHRFACIALLAIGLLLPTFGSAVIHAQVGEGRAVPRETYFLSLDPFYSGDYRTAMRGFRSSARSGRRSTEGLWIDSICYYSMMGECFYHMGDLSASLEQHEVALRLFANQRTWMKRMQWPANHCTRPGTSGAVGTKFKINIAGTISGNNPEPRRQRSQSRLASRRRR